MKVYLVAEVYCYSDEAMDKRFEVFSDKNSAIAYMNEVRETIILDLIDYNDYEDENELWSCYEQTFNYETSWGYLSPDCTTEYELEIYELDLLQWKEN